MDTTTTYPTVVKNQRITIPILGLSCGGGGSLQVERAIAKVAGVARVYVNACTEMAYVEYNPAICSPELIVSAVSRIGFGTGEVSLR
jgi:hypothetical protein